jgi:ATP-binding cassette subfamily B (MDR/TAP) protein 1
LDSASEKLVQDALDKLLLTTNHSVTTIVIAHRLHTVRNADYIAFLDQGKVIELGSHCQLMKKPDGAYRNMVERAGTSDVLPES